MRVAGVRVKEFGDEIFGQCIENGNVLMDGIRDHAKRLVPVGKVTRAGGFAARQISFIPKKGRNKGTSVEFDAEVWVGRIPGSLRNSIRRVNSVRNPGSIRVYAGNYKIYYAFMVERGTVKTRKQPFLRPAFEAAKAHALIVLKNGSL
jgi:HK97 gp10 family phage protein